MFTQRLAQPQMKWGQQGYRPRLFSGNYDDVGLGGNAVYVIGGNEVGPIAKGNKNAIITSPNCTWEINGSDIDVSGGNIVYNTFYGDATSGTLYIPYYIYISGTGSVDIYYNTGSGYVTLLHKSAGGVASGTLSIFLSSITLANLSVMIRLYSSLDVSNTWYFTCEIDDIVFIG